VKTLATGRRSQYETLPVDEEEKRSDKRERNKQAAKKYREKHENILKVLELAEKRLLEQNKIFDEKLKLLTTRKRDLERSLAAHQIECQLLSVSQNLNLPATVSDNEEAFSYTNLPTVVSLLPPTTVNLNEGRLSNDEYNLDDLLNTDMLQDDRGLMNSAYKEYSMDANTSYQPEQNIVQMSTSSFDRFLDETLSPTTATKNKDSSILFNSFFEQDYEN
jgi:hypothetical protein